jgi:hypothetical protein
MLGLKLELDLKLELIDRFHVWINGRSLIK